MANNTTKFTLLCSVIILSLLSALAGCASFIEALSPTLPKPAPITYPVETDRYRNDSFDLTANWMKTNFMSPKGEITLIDKEKGIIQVSDTCGIKDPNSADMEQVVFMDHGDRNIEFTIQAEIGDAKTTFIFQFASITPFGGSDPNSNSTLDRFCYNYSLKYYQYIQPPKGNQRIATEQDKKEEAFAQIKGAIKSTDGDFTIYIPTGTNKDELSNNKTLISLMESQVKNRPVGLSFPCERDYFYKFTRWMIDAYGFLPNATEIEAYYRDSTPDNDYMIVVSLIPPGLNIYVMTYEYFAATH
jgi:hypothetical protein